METEHRIAAPFSIYVDESGTPVFRTPEESPVQKGYVVAAIAVPALSQPSVLGMLPRNSSGELLKFSSRELTPWMLTCFVGEILRSDIEICLVMLSTVTDNNAALSKALVEFSNKRRTARHNPSVKEASLVYMFAAKDAIIGVLNQVSSRGRMPISFFDVVLDDASISKHDRRNFAAATRQRMEEAGLYCRDIRWTNERHEPMLYACDLLAGVYRRQAAQGDVRGALNLLEDAFTAGRILIQDGMTTPDPTRNP